MSESPEIRLQIDSLKSIIGKTIVGINWSKSFQRNGVKNIQIVKLPLKVSDIWCRGKVIVFETRDSESKVLYITSQLGMSGFWSETKYDHSNLWFLLLSLFFIGTPSTLETDSKLLNIFNIISPVSIKITM